MKKYLFTLIALLGTVLILQAQVRLPHIIADGMVLQRNVKARLWGWSSPAEKITLKASWLPDTLKTAADGNGKWEIFLPSATAGGPYEIDIKGNNHITLKNIFLGEVWVCSGQSNMEYSYNWNQSKDIAEDLPKSAQLNLHFFTIPKTTALQPQEDCPGEWKACDSNSLKSFSAVGYFFGKKLNENLNVPIGLISSNWGGTPAEPWTPDSVVNNDPVLRQAQLQLKISPYRPAQSGIAYNAMIAPLTPFQIAGVIWYQGEANVDFHSTYAALFSQMIMAWRKAWQQDLPFYYVQIAPYKYPHAGTAAYLREAQTQVLKVPNTAMVLTTDLVNDTANIHPLYKHEIGNRLAENALNQVYGMRQFNHFSPMYQSYTLNKNRIILEISHAENGLTSNHQKVKDLYIAGVDGKYYLADAKLEKGKITVGATQVPSPKFLKYGFDNTQTGNIFNAEGLPLAPFRLELP